MREAEKVETGKRMRAAESTMTQRGSERGREAGPERVEAWSAWSLGGCHRQRERERERERGGKNGALELEAVTEREREKGGGNVFS